MNTTIRLHGLLLGIGAAGAIALGACSTQRIDGPAGPESEFRGTAADFAGIPDEFVRVDRMGMPAVATAVISSKDAYNRADPTDDAAGAFVGEIVASITALHAALDDDLAALGLTPCATGDCVAQAAPFVVPDVIRIDPSRPAGFPNGRRLTDPVIDVTLALVLLDLGVHPVTTLIGVNPTANDRPFMGTFPYLARPFPATGKPS